MTGQASSVRRVRIYDLADELCDLYSRQFDVVRQCLAGIESEKYLERRERIRQLQTELKNEVSRSA
jgi:hypothetical protein